MSNLAPIHAAARPTLAPVPSPVTAPAISSWPDVDDLQRRFDALVKQPMRPISPKGTERVTRWFDEHCQGSKRLAEQAKTVIPGGV